MKILFTKKINCLELSNKLGNGFQVDCKEVITTEYLRLEKTEIKNKTLIFTSVNGVYSFLENGYSFSEHAIIVVGSKTRDAIISQSGKVIKTFAYASEMTEYIQNEQDKRYYLHFCGNLSLDILPQNEHYQKIISYQTHLLFPKIEKNYDAVVFFSPSGVRSFAKYNSFEKKIFFAIGNTTKQELQKYTKHITTSPTANLEGVLSEILNSKKMIKNDLYLRALKGETVERPPVWMMRQAGRYLPEFIALRDKYDFFTRCQTPELAAEITVQPIRRFPLDAAILFSDILVVPQAMGIDFKMKESVGPWLETPIRTKEQVEAIEVPNVNETLGYVFDSIDITLEKLHNEIPLIGFAGSPWTILCYCIEGKGSKSFDIAKSFCFQQPEVAHQFLQKITDTTIAYLKRKVEKGVSAVQIFDSWGGMLSPEDYKEFSWKYINQIVEALAPIAPTIVFAKGCWFALEEMTHSKASALGVDWTITPEFARKLTGNSITLQGNFDPARLHSSPETIKKMVHEMIHRFGKDKYIANLGHGILPNIPVQNAEAFIRAVVEWKPEY